LIVKKVPLIEVARFVNGKAFKPEEWSTEGLPIIRIQNLTGSTRITNYFNGEYDSKYLVRNGDILISWSASLGVYIWQGENALLNQHIFKCNLRSGVDKNYFYYAATFILEDLKKQVHGSTMQHITKDPFESTLIPLPPLPEQQRIAAILQKADRLRRLRRYARQLSDGYLQSVFLEMFGDPKKNPKGWGVARFKEVCESRLGKMLDEKNQTGKNNRPYLRNFNVQWFKFDLSNVAEMDFDESDRSEFRLRYGDILICEGGEVGRTAIWHDEIKECYYQKALHRARPNSKLVTSEYIMYLMLWMAKTGGLGDFTSQVTIAHLTGEKLKELIIPIPPLLIQNKFLDIVKRYTFLSNKLSESERQTEILFQSLLQRAFRGEL